MNLSYLPSVLRIWNTQTSYCGHCLNARLLPYAITFVQSQTGLYVALEFVFADSCPTELFVRAYV